MLSCPCLVCAGRAVGLSVGALVAGILLGAGLNAWLRVDIVPIGVSGADAVRGTSAVVCLPSCSAREGSWKLHGANPDAEAWRVCLLQSFGSPGVLVSTFGITTLALASAFLA